MQLSTISLALTRLGGLFSPAALFAGGTVAGAWYDPSDLSTMFTTSAGTTPVAMPGLGAPVPVGLMLDKSQGLVLGSELVTNGDFSNGTTGWSSYLNGQLAVVSGELRVTNGASLYGAAYQDETCVIGKWYKATVKCRVGTTPRVYLSIRTSSPSGTEVASASTTSATDVQISCVFLATATTMSVVLSNDIGTNATGFFDNISVRELPGNHAIAFNNSTKRPVLMARVNLLEYSEQFDNGAWTNLNAATNIVANATTAPNGTNTADFFRVAATTNADHLIRATNTVSVAASTYILTWRIKANGITRFRMAVASETSLTNRAWVNVNLTTRAQTGGNDGLGFTFVSSDVTLEDAYGFQTVSLTYTTTVGTAVPYIVMQDASGNFTFAGTVDTGLYIWGADLRPANIGANVPAYQRIADALTYDTSGFPLYLYFDGADDSMYTPASIPFATVTSDGQARRNLLSFPTVFNDPFWTVSGTTVSANSTTAPDGTTTADTLTETAAAGSHQIYNTSQLMGVPTPLCMSVYVKPNGRTWVFLGDDGGGVFFNLIGAGSVGTQQAGRTGSISSVGDGWYRVVVTGNRPAVNDSVYIALCSADNTLSYTGNGTSGVFIWGAQFEAGSTATAFQNIGTDKVAVFAGVRKLSDAAAGFVAEFSVNSSSNDGAFLLAAPRTSAEASYGFRTKGTGLATYAGTTYAAPITNVTSCVHDIAGATIAQEIIPRVNGATPTLTATDAGPAGTGNFGTYPLYIGSRANSGVWLNGHLYSLAVVGSAVSAGNIDAMESWVAGRTGIQI